jgi:hypothetical protein
MSANQSARSIKPRHRILGIIAVILALTAILLFSAALGPTSVEIRLDTGDLRYFYFGIPLDYEKMPEPARSQLLSLASQSSILKPQWHSIPMREGSNNVDGMYFGFYRRAAAWVVVDPRIARWAAEDISTQIDQSGGREGLPQSIGLLSAVGWTGFGLMAVKPDWNIDRGVLEYLERKNYVLPP